jgi:uncharacterized protein YqgC (DUF456 family)
MAESLLIILAGIVMVASLFLIVIPAVPVSALVWSIAMLSGALTGFMRFTPAAAVIATIFMVLGSTSGLWMPFFGMRGRQLSFQGFVAFFLGMIAGSALIPIPFVGTILGGMIGIIAIEFWRQRQMGAAWRSGKSALRVILMSMASELIFAGLIILTYIISVVTTIP